MMNPLNTRKATERAERKFLSRKELHLLTWFTALAFRHINNNPFNTSFVFHLPPGKTNRLHTSET